jgi:cytochrome c oxidase subunit 2
VPTTSVHDPRGIVAAETASLGVVMFALAGVVFALVLLLLLIAVFRARGGEQWLQHASEPQLREGWLARLGSTTFIVAGGVVMPLVILAPVLVMTFRSMAALAEPDSRQPGEVKIEVTAHQYWWEVHYPDSGFETANEIHVPVGTPVQLTLHSSDVIHSFWVPQLFGKRDLTPGRATTTWFQADEAGVFRGECAELCGIQHARMYFLVIAEPQEDFAAWLDSQKQPASTPQDQAVQRGAGVFAREGCIECHAIRYSSSGPPTGGQIAPDLTHVGGRRTLASAIMANTQENMLSWIGDPQALKPGNAMPTRPMDAESLRALAAYLSSLD